MLYEKIKKEHVFIFVILLASLIVFSSFDEFGYTGLVTKEKNNEVTGNFAFISFGDFLPVNVIDKATGNRTKLY